MFKLRIPTKSLYFSSNDITHLQMMDELLEFAMKWGRLIGGGIFDQGFKRTNKNIVTLMLLTALTCIINVYDIYLFREDVPRCVFCILTISGQVQGFAKFYSFIWLFKNILNLREQSKEFHKKVSSLKSSKIFEEKFMIVAHMAAVITFLAISTFILIATYPIIYYLIFEKRILHFGLELPLIDWKFSWIGYGINFIHQGGLLFLFICMTIKTLCIIICFIASAICQFDVLEMLLVELNELAIFNQDGSKDGEICTKIRFLVDQHTNLIQYLQDMRRTFLVYFFIDFSALVFQKTVELFAIISVSYYKSSQLHFLIHNFQFNFIPGYVCAISTGFLIFLPCVLGSILISKGDEFYRKLYNISWHLLSISNQKSFKFIILNSKTSKGLAAGIQTLELTAFLEVNVSSLSQVKVYEN
ncbi:hypothetical protein ACKWTF_006453 [Chironomus riparius]